MIVLTAAMLAYEVKAGPCDEATLSVLKEDLYVDVKSKEEKARFVDVNAKEAVAGV